MSGERRTAVEPYLERELSSLTFFPLAVPPNKNDYDTRGGQVQEDHKDPSIRIDASSNRKGHKPNGERCCGFPN
ncbi:MAG TPA: hypothetical protein VFH95_10695, partial [Candidatus Kapabacteria bacterium]|nr:hypothetical protein [Candidatus Kapabacteria bacterium]